MVAQPPSLTAQPVLPPLARGPLLVAFGVAAVLYSAFSDGYGFHRDELYFRMLQPAWGYVDQPPLSPLVAHGVTSLVDQPWALRIPSTVLVLVSALVLVLLTRELGGGRTAQILCAWGYLFAVLPVAFGHVFITATLDLPCWPAILLFIIRAQRRAQPRWWLAAGVVAGVSTYNKLLVAVLLVALAVGILAVGPRRLLVERWVLGAVVLLVVIGAPNLLYQAIHGWPQFAVGHALAEHHGGEVRSFMWPLLFLMLGPPLVPIWLVGLRLFAAARELRFIAVAFPVVLVLVYVMGSQPYYELGLVAVLFAAGCVPTAGWLQRAGWRRVLVTAGVTLNALVAVVSGLPIIPVAAVGATPIPSINQISRDSIGWPRYVAEVAAVYRQVPADDRAGTVVYASNYGEAGAIDRFGPQYGLPTVYSGQNALWYARRPADSADVVVFVGGQYDDGGRQLFARCRVAGHLDNDVDVDNEEQGEPIALCRSPIGGWSRAWPRLRKID